MGVLNSRTHDLWKWQVHQQQKTRSSNIQPGPTNLKMKHESPEDILASTKGFNSDEFGSGDDGSANDSEEDEASQGVSSDSSDEECSDDNKSQPEKKHKVSLRCIKKGDDTHRGSPKRPREDDNVSIQWSMNDPPQQPTFHYPPNYQYQPQASQASLSHQNGMFGSLPHHSAPPISMLPQPHNAMLVNHTELYNPNYAAEIGLPTQLYYDTIHQTPLPAQSIQIPDVPTPKKARKGKRIGSRGGTLAHRRTT
ncbi:hypothetical protein EJ02DRAFT_98192 [Clathrospora elynae]|uniref:Uncharacterized protein n=1 Tax=Clathrospora elynae TaxID=706981 RepID=A0A6A5SFL4_9PLEO|nr:hypothetical protein EJ02DRAFT_98192 [Clathrospora elynae]